MDIFLLIAIIVSPFLVGLLATLLIPSNAQIQKNCFAVAKSQKRIFVYAVGILLLFAGIVILLLLFADIIRYDVAYILNMIFCISIGIGLIAENFRKQRYAHMIIRTVQQYQYAQGPR